LLAASSPPRHAELIVQRITDLYAKTVEKQGIDVDITLLVDGVPITGVLTSTFHYYAWVTDRMGGADKERRAPVGAVALPSAEQREEAVASWRRRVERAREQNGGASDEALEDSIDLYELALRNAEMQVGDPHQWTRYSYVLVQADAVDAVMLGKRGLKG
jgi:hypothetical protein